MKLHAPSKGFLVLSILLVGLVCLDRFFDFHVPVFRTLIGNHETGVTDPKRALNVVLVAWLVLTGAVIFNY